MFYIYLRICSTKDREDFEREAFENFEGRCFTARREISAPGQKFVDLWQLCLPQNARSREPLFTSGVHKKMFLVKWSKLAAYRQEKNLHFNYMMTGDAQTSKSFVLEKIEQDCNKTFHIILVIDTEHTLCKTHFIYTHKT